MMSPDLDPGTRAALDALDATLLARLGGAGWAHVEPGQILDAETLLDLYGEDVRGRAFVFDGPSGDLCLRPDLTLSICRYHVTHAAAEGEARYLAAGPVFRRPTASFDGAGKPSHPGLTRVSGGAEPWTPGSGPGVTREPVQAGQFRQIGCEWFGGADAAAIDADIFARTQGALLEAGCTVEVTTGDLGILFSLIDAAPIPDRWRARLKRHVWRPHRFRALLHELSEGRADEAGRLAFLKALGGLAPEQARGAVAHMLDLSGTVHVGLRTHDEISERFLEQAEDAQAHPLPCEIVAAIEAAAALKAPCADALESLHAIARETGLALGPALSRFEARMAALERQGIDAAMLPFDGDFGRNLEYYDGFVFEILDRDTAAGGDRRAAQLAGGGRYDSVLPAAARAFGAAECAARGAVGAALRPEAILSTRR